MIGLIIMKLIREKRNKMMRNNHLVVARNGNIDVTKRRVGIGQSDNGDVNVRGFNDGLVISTWIHDHQKTWLAESGLNLVSEGSRGETACNGCSLGVRGKLEGSTLALRARRDDEDIIGVLNSHDGPGSQKKLFISPAQIDDVDTWMDFIVELQN